MLTLTSLHRAILNVLDTCEHGAGETEISKYVWCSHNGFTDQEALLQAIVELCNDDLITARLRDDQADCGVSADPIIYSLSETGADALWALLRADAIAPAINDLHPLAVWRPVRFENRREMRSYLRSAA